MSTPINEDTTIALLQRWHGGDREALGLLLEETEPWLRAAIRPRLLHSIRRVEDSLDFAQSAVARFLAWGPRFLPASRAQFRALMKRIAINEIVDRARRICSQQGGARLPGAEGYGDTVLNLVADRTRDRPLHAAVREENHAWMRLAMELMQENERQLLLARLEDRRSWDEIATLLELPSAEAARMSSKRLLRKLPKTIRKLQSGGLDDLLRENSLKQEDNPHVK